MNSRGKNAESLAIFVPSLGGGGAEAAAVSFANGLARRGHRVVLVTLLSPGEGQKRLDPRITRKVLPQSRLRFALLHLVLFFRHERPMIFVSFLRHANFLSIIARALGGLSTKLVISERNSLRETELGGWLSSLTQRVGMRLLYPLADHLICVSQGVRDELIGFVKMSPSKVSTVYNPVITGDFEELMNEAVSHPWLKGERTRGSKCLVAVGRLVEQKDFVTLLEALSILRQSLDVKLIILGCGPMEETLRKKSNSLGLSSNVEFQGHLANPLPWIAKSDCFVLSSLFEGLPAVLVQALATGCRIVSTDCEHGPREILQGGLYGHLVPIRNPKAMADAILLSLQSPRRRVARDHLEKFMFEPSIERFYQVIRGA